MRKRIEFPWGRRNDATPSYETTKESITKKAFVKGFLLRLAKKRKILKSKTHPGAARSAATWVR
jgi:hypothetical protein